jgi:hypothetical protein
LVEIQNWYQSQCDGDWEHVFGVTIDTLDNPGWHVTINLEDTNLEDKLFSEIKTDNSEEDWFICRVTDKKFEGAGDPQKLEKIVQIFLEWSKS